MSSDSQGCNHRVRVRVSSEGSVEVASASRITWLLLEFISLRAWGLRGIIIYFLSLTLYLLFLWYWQAWCSFHWSGKIQNSVWAFGLLVLGYPRLPSGGTGVVISSLLTWPGSGLYNACQALFSSQERGTEAWQDWIGFCGISGDFSCSNTYLTAESKWPVSQSWLSNCSPTPSPGVLGALCHKAIGKLVVPTLTPRLALRIQLICLPVISRVHLGSSLQPITISESRPPSVLWRNLNLTRMPPNFLETYKESFQLHVSSSQIRGASNVAARVRAMLAYTRPLQWSAGNQLSGGGGKSLMCSIYWFLWCQYSHHCWLKATNVMSLSTELG